MTIIVPALPVRRRPILTVMLGVILGTTALTTSGRTADPGTLPGGARLLARPPQPSSADPSATASSPARPRVDGPKLAWTMSWWGRSRPITAGAEHLAKRVAEETGGNWTIRIRYRSALARPQDNLDRLTEGRFEMAAFCNFFHPRKNPALMALSMPFLPILDWSDNQAVRDAVYAHPGVLAEFEARKVRLYVSTYLPPFEFIGTGKPPQKPADWKGMTVRAGGGIGRALKLLGAIPVNATPQEIHTGLRYGTMQAAALPATYALVAYRIPDVASWFTTDFAAGTFDCPLAIAMTAYDRLPTPYKTLLAELRSEVAKAQIRAYQDADARNLPVLTSKLTRISIPKTQLRDYRKRAGLPVIEAWIAANQTAFDARELIETIFRAAGEPYP